MRCFIPILLLVTVAAEAQTRIPQAANQYRRPLISNARFVWGLDAPIAVMAGQLHQESGWRKDAKSAFASGLSQFTPSTADWISAKFPDELGANQPFNPDWALRALARYDKFLYDRQISTATDCDRWAFTLAGYNGGEGWIVRDRRIAISKGADPKRWWGHVEKYSGRAAWAFKENRGYPRNILLRWMPTYERAGWGRGVACDV